MRFTHLAASVLTLLTHLQQLFGAEEFQEREMCNAGYSMIACAQPTSRPRTAAVDEGSDRAVSCQHAMRALQLSWKDVF